MKRKKIIYSILLILLSIFSFNIEAKAAKELTCVYEIGEDKPIIGKAKAIPKVILVQYANGDIIVYKNDKDVDITTTENYWSIYDEKKYSIMRDATELNNSLTKCPTSKNTAAKDGYTHFYFNDYGKQKLLTSKEEAITPTLSKTETKIPELTCIYKQGSDSINKVAITQSSNGKITMYKNEKDVGLADPSSYWEISTNAIIWDDSSEMNTLGYLTACPPRKTTNQEFAANGEVTFYGGKKDENDENQYEELEAQYNKIETIQLKQTSDKSDEINYDNDKYTGKECSKINNSEKWLSDHENYTLSCLYQRTIDKYGVSNEKGCHIIQINIGKSGVDTFDSESPFFDGIQGRNYGLNNEAITEPVAISINNGECPVQLMVERSRTNPSNYLGTDYMLSTRIDFSGTGSAYTLVAADGKNLVTGAKASSEFSYKLYFEEIQIKNCDDLFGKDSETIKDMLKTGINIVKIFIPIILLVLGSLDFAQAVFSSNEDGIKKAQSKFIKRLIIAVIIFLIPTILKLILTLGNSIWPIIDADLCGII